MNSTKTKTIILTVGILAALGILIAVGIGRSDSFAYYLTVSEFLEKRPGPDENFRVNGEVEPGSVSRAGSGLEASFVITDGERSMPVSYRGPVPDSLADGVDVVIEGSIDDDGLFMADNMLAKCPSKYEARGERHPDDVERDDTAAGDAGP